ncbi:MAG: hypothetical protein JSV32_08665 [Dehalococcoidia bacterium]|nr:MAG: hypothetical protein JSV32_08665 [Dehalococcoidia bacterium]
MSIVHDKMIGQTWNYNSYLDFEKGLNAVETLHALKELSKLASMIKISGSYKKSFLARE